MIEVRRSGPSLDAVARDIRDVPARVLPYASAIALTKGAKHGQKAVVAQMSVVFHNPVAYTLNATRIEVATKDKLSARIAVKNQGNARPQSYLLPEVEGGARRFKGFEVALQRAGILGAGMYAVPGRSVALGQNGSVGGYPIRTILAQVTRPQKGSRLFVRNGAKNNRWGATRNVHGTPGIWEREAGGRGIHALFIFTSKAPKYRPALDFTGIAATAVRDNFASDFYAAAQSLRRKLA